MAFEVFTPLFQTVDQATSTFVHDISARCVKEITPVIITALTISFISYGLLIIRDIIEVSITDFLRRSLRTIIITNIALMGGFYQTEIGNLIQVLPDDLAKTFITNPEQNMTAASLIDEAAGAGFNISSVAFDKAGIFSFEGLTYCLIGLIITLMTGLFIAVGGAFLLMSKIALSILAGLGPLFISALIFPVTARFFDLWLGQIINYILLVILYAAVFSLMMTIFKNYMTHVKMDELNNIGYTIGGLCVLSFSMLIVLRQLPLIASSLAGGVSLSFSSGLKFLSTASSSLKNSTSFFFRLLPPKKEEPVSSSQQAAPVQKKLNLVPRLISRGYYKGGFLNRFNKNLGDKKS